MSGTPSTKPPVERRARRERALLDARLSIAGGVMTADCTVVQVSGAGAKLNVAEGVALPDEFDIAIPQRHFTGRARLVWRSGAQAGIEFVEAPEEGEAASIGELQKRMRLMAAELQRLRSENQKLRGELKRVTGV